MSLTPFLHAKHKVLLHRFLMGAGRLPTRHSLLHHQLQRFSVSRGSYKPNCEKKVMPPLVFLCVCVGVSVCVCLFVCVTVCVLTHILIKTTKCISLLHPPQLWLLVDFASFYNTMVERRRCDGFLAQRS